MDESHRYRASAGIRAINDLQPLLGLELTATPFIEGPKGPIRFNNVVLDYPLALALEDGYVKEPAVITQRNLDPKRLSAAELEDLKLRDGIRIHELTKAELLTYSRDNGAPLVKPFMLIIARDTSHARSLYEFVQSSNFFGGSYRDKVIQVDSSKSGADEEETIRRLLAVEKVDEPTEIVIHVNMLKEGWDVTNLFTIVPLRAANARTLIEQSIGRGLRLPYGKKTGVAAVDRLNIIAHDRFQEIVDEANRTDSPIRMGEIQLDPDFSNQKIVSIDVRPQFNLDLGVSAAHSEVDSTAFPDSSVERLAQQKVFETIGKYQFVPDVLPSAKHLTNPNFKQKIIDEVFEYLQMDGSENHNSKKRANLVHLIEKTTADFSNNIISIPQIHLVPVADHKFKHRYFDVDLTNLDLKPTVKQLVGQVLRTNEQFYLSTADQRTFSRLEDFIVSRLREYEDVSYEDEGELLYNLARQVVEHFQNLYSDDETRDIISNYRHVIADEIHSQMKENIEQATTVLKPHITRGFTSLRNFNFTANAELIECNFRETLKNPGQIKQMLFTGFKRCLYPMQKFDSDAERRFALVLDRDCQRWFKPAKGQFNIFYHLKSERHEYVPDFVADAGSLKLIVETKARNSLSNSDVVSKSQTAAAWCKFASEYAMSLGEPVWKYLLVPDDEISEAKRLEDYLRFEVKPT